MGSGGTKEMTLPEFLAWEAHHRSAVAVHQGLRQARQIHPVPRREYVLVDPAERHVEVFTLADAEAWILIDQTKAVELTLSSIGLKLPMASVFRGVE